MSRQALRLVPSTAAAARALARPAAAAGRRAASSSSSSAASTSGPAWRRPAAAGALAAVGLGLASYGLLDLSHQTDLFASSSGGGSPAARVSAALGQVQLDAAPLAADDPSVRVDPSTSLAFPLALSPLSLPAPPLALVGLGVRTVSFLRVKVYSAGFYVAPGAPAWGVAGMGGEDSMAAFLRGPEPCAMRIVPARSTDFAHLRDGLVRAVQGRLKGLLKAGLLTEAEAEEAAAALQTFKTFFPSRAAERGSELVLVKLPAGAGLAVEFAGQKLGSLANPVVAREVFASYFLDGGREISPKLKESIVAGFQSRPQ